MNMHSEQLSPIAHDYVYQCPRTGIPLSVEQTSLVDLDGVQRYAIVRGVPNFLRYDEAEPPDVSDRLSRANEIARRVGWRHAVQEVYGDWRYVFPEGRDVWMALLPCTSDSTVLEIGSGMGQFTPLLSQRSRQVHALEVVPGQAEFTLQRCQQEGCRNVAVACGGDDCRLPYRDASFDLVVMNLVFEWCAERSSQQSNMVAGQRLLLSEVSRVLNRHGALYLMTKNRFALRLCLGKRDEHCYSMRWGNALPRWLMTAMLRLRGRSAPRGVLHSHGALMRMLNNAGFKQISSYWAIPEMRYPSACIPTDRDSIRTARRRSKCVQGEFRSTRLLMPLVPASWVKYVTPGLQFVARRTDIAGGASCSRQV